MRFILNLKRIYGVNLTKIGFISVIRLDCLFIAGSTCDRYFFEIKVNVKDMCGQQNERLNKIYIKTILSTDPLEMIHF